ncbi:MAG: hypothetical protein LBT92_00045 [Rickettsiales bacterium]|nr:hypothetical protein [Rickettsiales bacterium]
MFRALRSFFAFAAALLLCLEAALAAPKPRKSSGGAKAGGKQAKGAGGTKRKRRSAATATSAAKVVVKESGEDENEPEEEPEPEPKVAKAPPPPALEEEEEPVVAEEESIRPKSPNYEAMLADPSKIPDVHEDPAWAGFRKCMTSSCMGGDDQPDHVNCYRNVTFEQVFEECRAMIDDPEKEDNFMAYFKVPFLNEEKKAFCAEHFSGTYNEIKDQCTLTIKFARDNKPQKGFGMAPNPNERCNDNTSKVFSFGAAGKKIMCSYETFGLGECYNDNPDLIKNQMNVLSGTVQMATGALAGVAGGFAAVASAQAARVDRVNKQMEIDNKNRSSGGGEPAAGSNTGDPLPADTSTKLSKGQTAAAAIAGGLASGGELVTTGIGSLATGLSGMNEKGGLYLGGKCTLPDESIVREGSVINLRW